MACYMGLDVGTKNSCIAVVQGKCLDVAVNSYGRKQTPTCVGFGEYKRVFGHDAAERKEDNVAGTIDNFMPFIGSTARNNMKTFQEHCSYQLEFPGNRAVNIKVQYNEKTYEFTPEQILAMHLSFLKRTCEKYSSSETTRCVLNVPIFYTAVQRASLLAACQIANINCAMLLEDTDAVAIFYYLYNLHKPAVDEPEKYVVFVDVGHIHTQVAVYGFKKDLIRRICAEADSNLGGWHFDQVIYEQFENIYFEKQGNKIDPHSYTAVHIRNECSLLKERFSRSTNGLSAEIENLPEGIILELDINESNFEEWSKEPLKRLEDLLNRCLRASKLNKEQIHSVEMVGSGFHLPFIRRLIHNVFGREGLTSLHGDEVIACGCAIHAAVLADSWLWDNYPTEDLHIDESVQNPSNQDIERYRKVEAELYELDQETINELNARNDCEEKIYNYQDELKKIPVTESERKHTCDLLTTLREEITSAPFKKGQYYTKRSQQLSKERAEFQRQAVERWSIMNDYMKLKREVEKWLESQRRLKVFLIEFVNNPALLFERYDNIEKETAETLNRGSLLQQNLYQYPKECTGSKGALKIFQLEHSENNIHSPEIKQNVCELQQSLESSKLNATNILDGMHDLRNSSGAELLRLISQTKSTYKKYLELLAYNLFYCWWLMFYTCFIWDNSKLEPQHSSSKADVTFLLSLTTPSPRERVIIKKFKKAVKNEQSKLHMDQLENDNADAWFDQYERLLQSLNEMKAAEPGDDEHTKRPISEIWNVWTSAQHQNAKCIDLLSKLQPSCTENGLLKALLKWMHYHQNIQEAFVNTNNYLIEYCPVNESNDSILKVIERWINSIDGILEKTQRCATNLYNISSQFVNRLIWQQATDINSSN